MELLRYTQIRLQGTALGSRWYGQQLFEDATKSLSFISCIIAVDATTSKLNASSQKYVLQEVQYYLACVRCILKMPTGLYLYLQDLGRRRMDETLGPKLRHILPRSTSPGPLRHTLQQQISLGSH